MTLIALALCAQPALADTLWGVAGDYDDYHGWQVFSVDTDSGAVNALPHFDPFEDGRGYFYPGDIAEGPDGSLYLMVWGYDDGIWGDAYDTLLRLDSADGSVLGAWDLTDVEVEGWEDPYDAPDATFYDYGIVALEFIDDRLYGVEGGGLLHAELIELELDEAGDYVARHTIDDVTHFVGGDLAIHPETREVVGTFWDWFSDGTPMWLWTFGLEDPIAAEPVVDLGYTSVAGIAYSSDGTLWGGQAWGYGYDPTLELYVVDTVDGSVTPSWDLSASLDARNDGLGGLSRYTPPIPTGACCAPEACVDALSEAACLDLDGGWFGADTLCAEADDADADLLPDACDLCPEDPEPSDTDSDADGFGDACDVCPALSDPDQLDSDADSVGDACDLCPSVSDPEQLDGDGDGVGDACDLCPEDYDPEQEDLDGDGIGDACAEEDPGPQDSDPSADDSGVDSGSVDSGLIKDEPSCSCTGAPGAGHGLGLALLAGLLMRRRRSN